MRKKDDEEKSFVSKVFIIFLIIVLIFAIMYVFSKDYRKSVNKDLSKVFKVNIDEKTKFLDNLFKKEKEPEEKENIINEDEEKTEVNENKKTGNTEKKENTEKNQTKNEVLKEKTPEEKALSIVNKKYNDSGAYMSYIMDKKNDKEFIVGFSDPETTNLKAVYIVNIDTEKVELKR